MKRPSASPLLAALSCIMLGLFSTPASAGTWVITSSFSGDATADLHVSTIAAASINNQGLSSGGTYPLPASAVGLNMWSGLNDHVSGYYAKAHTVDTRIRYTFTWQPAAGQNLISDPPPLNNGEVTVTVTLNYQLSTLIWFMLPGPPIGTVTYLAKVTGDGVDLPDQSGVISGNSPGGRTFLDSGQLVVKKIHQVNIVIEQGIGHGTLDVPMSTKTEYTYTGPTNTDPEFRLPLGSAQAVITPSAATTDVVLTTPNAAVFPTKGNAANKYVYDGNPPDPNNIHPNLGNPPWTATFINADPNQSIMNTTFVSFNVGASVMTSGALTVTGNTITQQFNYVTLPANNSDFGNKTVTLTVGAPFNTTQTANVQVFFPGSSFNHPGPDLPRAAGVATPTPNWYFYWSQNQTGANYGQHVYGGANGAESGVTYFDVPQAKWVSKIYDAASTHSASGCFDSAEGIDYFANICRHEEQHRLLLIDWWGPNGSGGDNGTTNNVDPTMRETDLDGDYIPDSLEAAIGSLYHSELGGYSNIEPWTPGLEDHFHYGDGFNDDEDYTLHTQHIWRKGDADKYDWSDIGHQY